MKNAPETQFSADLKVYRFVDRKARTANSTFAIGGVSCSVERFLECCIVEFDENGEMVSFDIKPDCKLLQDEKKNLKNLA